MNKVISNNITENIRPSFIIAKGVIISVVITLIAIFIFAIIMAFTDFSEESIAPVIIGISALSILAGSSLSSIKIHKNGMLNGGIIGLIYMLFLYLVSSGIGTGFALNFNSIIMILLGIVAGMIGRNSRSKYKKIMNVKI